MMQNISSSQDIWETTSVLLHVEKGGASGEVSVESDSAPLDRQCVGKHPAQAFRCIFIGLGGCGEAAGAVLARRKRMELPRKPLHCLDGVDMSGRDVIFVCGEAGSQALDLAEDLAAGFKPGLVLTVSPQSADNVPSRPIGARRSTLYLPR